MKILVACEFSGIVREAFRLRGHDAWSCDLLPTEIPGQHIQDDVLNHPDEAWDMMIAFPPCTYLTNAGVRHLYNHVLSSNGKQAAVHGEARWGEMKKAAEFFRRLLNADIPKICVENPIPHRYAVAEIGRKYDQLIQPFWFGDPYQKATCMWLKGLVKLKPTNVVEGREQKCHKEPPSPNRWKNRSRTYKGIAEAMATQWGTKEGWL